MGMLLGISSVEAKVTLPSIISDNMVLKYMKAHMTRAERRDAKATKAWTLTHKKN